MALSPVGVFSVCDGEIKRDVVALSPVQPAIDIKATKISAITATTFGQYVSYHSVCRKNKLIVQQPMHLFLRYVRGYEPDSPVAALVKLLRPYKSEHVQL